MAALAAMDVIFAALLFALGASLGSFLNVVIYRLPIGASLARPSSRCPGCEVPIRWRHNLPVIGWLVRRGRCAHCGVAISGRYPLVELAMGLLTLALWADLAGGSFDPVRLAEADFAHRVLVPFVLYLTFVGTLLACTFIDLDWFILPNSLTLPLIPLGVATAFATGPQVGVTWEEAALGAALGAAVVLIIIVVYGALTGRVGMGGGDWKLLAGVGAFLGWRALPFVLLAASVQGLLCALAFRRSFAQAVPPPDPLDPEPLDPEPPPAASATSATPEAVPFRRLAVPFGPFLALAAVEYLLFRDELHQLLISLGRG